MFMKTDLSYLREMSGGNTGLVLEMIGIFREQVVEFGKDMDQHLENREYELLGKLAHKAKSSVSIMGLQDLAGELKNLENFAREGKKVESYAGIIAKFKQDTAIAVQELDVVTNNIELYF
jgi:HPt (histidine-containing phosphotransfer) domain-containing protein